MSSTIEIGDNQAVIPLSKAAKLNSSGERVTISCQCKGQCSTNRCRCFKNNLRCSVHCHREVHDCGFLKPLTERTEANLAKGGDSASEEEGRVEGDKNSSKAKGKGKGKRAPKRARANTAGDQL